MSSVVSVSNAPDFECLDVEQVAPELREQALREGNTAWSLVAYGLIGAYLGTLFIWSEVASWYRIQEMFRFDSFHLYGVIGSALAVAAPAVWLIKKHRLRTLHGEPIEIEPKTWGSGRLPGPRYIVGGTLFGMGWALLGACPGPIFALIGAGLPVMFVGLAAAVAGTWAYAVLRPYLPH